MLLKMGINDPSQCRAAVSADGVITRQPYSPASAIEAEYGNCYRHESFLELIVRAMRLDGLPEHIHARAPAAVAGWGQNTYCTDYWRAQSVSNLSALFVTTFASLFAAAWDQAGDSTEGWVGETESLNLKRTERIRLGGVQLKRRQRGQEATHISFVATAENAQLGCFAAQFQIDEQDVVDDVTGELLRASAEQLAAAARALRPDLVYSTLFRNAALSDSVALFHATHANLNTTAALAEATLAAAGAGIAKQKDDTVALNLRGDYLIVPTALERTAGKLARDVDLLNPSSRKPPVVVSDSRLDNGLVDPTNDAVHAGSATTWYMSTAGRHALEVMYLQGRNKLPEVRSGFLPGGSFGFAFDIEHFLAVMAVDYRGLSKNTA
jgi:hypothetical protein